MFAVEPPMLKVNRTRNLSLVTNNAAVQTHSLRLRARFANEESLYTFVRVSDGHPWGYNSVYSESFDFFLKEAGRYWKSNETFFLHNKSDQERMFNVMELIIRYAIQMKIWIAQILEALQHNELWTELEDLLKTWFGDMGLECMYGRTGLCNRDYAIKMLRTMYASCTSLSFALDSVDDGQNAKCIGRYTYTGCTPKEKRCRPTGVKYEKDPEKSHMGNMYFLIRLAPSFLTHTLTSLHAGLGMGRLPSAVGVLAHEMTHIIGDDGVIIGDDGIITNQTKEMHPPSAWHLLKKRFSLEENAGAVPPGGMVDSSARIFDDGRLATADYAYGWNNCIGLANKFPREARHNADNWMYFIQTSILRLRKKAIAAAITLWGYPYELDRIEEEFSSFDGFLE